MGGHRVPEAEARARSRRGVNDVGHGVGVRRGGDWPLSVAPMMDWTDRHYRRFLRFVTRRTPLYTEMITTGAILHGDRERLLGFSRAEHPLALQLGGDDPRALAECARIASAWGYDEINLNVGCPSDRVQSGRFGACLMARPDDVARCVEALRAATDLPVGVKHRIGIDDLDTYEHMLAFVDTVAAAGADRFTVHARKAWLEGLSPKENRTVPPLRYDDVYRLKAERPGLRIEINGGVRTLDEAKAHLERVDGVMIGRAAYETPYVLSDADRRFFGDARPPLSRHEVVRAMLPYVEEQRTNGVYLGRITRHMLGLFAGRPGARAWKRHISENAHRPGAGPDVLLAALELVPEEATSLP
jgi:tRNA-dihydrouridine synthase A